MPLRIAPVMLLSKRPTKAKTTVAAMTPMTTTVLKNPVLKRISWMFSPDFPTAHQKDIHMTTNPTVARIERPRTYSGDSGGFWFSVEPGVDDAVCDWAIILMNRLIHKRKMIYLFFEKNIFFLPTWRLVPLSDFLL